MYIYIINIHILISHTYRHTIYIYIYKYIFCLNILFPFVSRRYILFDGREAGKKRSNPRDVHRWHVLRSMNTISIYSLLSWPYPEYWCFSILDSANHPLPKNKLRIPPTERWLQSGFWFWPKHSLDTRGMLASVPLALDGFCCDSSTLRQTNVGNIGRQDVVDMTKLLDVTKHD